MGRRALTILWLIATILAGIFFGLGGLGQLFRGNFVGAGVLLGLFGLIAFKYASSKKALRAEQQASAAWGPQQGAQWQADPRTAPAAAQYYYGGGAAGQHQPQLGYPAPQFDASRGAPPASVGAARSPSRPDWIAALEAPVPASPPSPQAAPAARWYAAHVPLQLGAYVISGGMFYVGRSEFVANRYEPAIIDPSLPVDMARADRLGAGLPYWPAYATISPAERGGYIRWLASGRSDPEAGLGYVFLFFYGLERRLLRDGLQGNVHEREREQIRAEIRRLLTIYGTNRSFRGYASQLLELSSALDSPSVDQVPAAPAAAKDPEFPLALRIGLGQFAQARTPVPPAWALAWVLSDPDLSLPRAARRCDQEFRDLFLVRYQEAFGQGMTVPASARGLTRKYRAASASLGTIEVPFGVPDVAARRASRTKLAELALRCASELDSYSRLLGRAPNARGSIAALALLPAPLVARWQGGEFDGVVARAEAAFGGSALAVVPASVFFPAKPTKADALAFLRVLEARGIGIEPDIRFGGSVPKEDSRLVLFRITGQQPKGPTPEYQAVALLLHVAAAVAAADGHIADAELAHLRGRLDAMMQLSDAERTRLLAHLRWLVEERPGVAGLKKRLVAATERQREAIADLVIGVVWADGKVETDEVKMLTKLFPLLGLDPKDVHRRIHAYAAANATPAEEPVAVITGTPAPGFAIPPQPSGAAGLRLDAAAIARKERESAAVSELLKGIFVEEDHTSAESREAPPPSAEVEPSAEATLAQIGKLSGALLAFAQQLSGRPSWPRTDVEALATKLGLMTDGALEKINDVAFDSGDAPFAIGDDPIEIDPSALKELAS